ncbi:MULTISPECIES: N-acyl homoserine lactonase family protein [unclassified Microbulbifer]|uniref:N-acyl homoserine lactonase family protein n=1 Tax=unclassified Microbulbifer TaxID=2619833 RepID=UPI0027E51286|nr:MULTISPECIES: N-acyl homoserine lactonase family protein [unclassified Microbulbifer]
MHYPVISQLFFFFALSLLISLPASAASSSLRLYAMDCGSLSLESMALFEDTDAYAGTPGHMAVPCFLVRHPKGDLIWDTGLGDHLAGQAGGVEIAEGITARVPVSLRAQLQQLKLVPVDIEFVSFSHFHFDHTNNASLFANSTFLLNRRGADWALGSPTPFGVNPDSLKVIDGKNRQLLDLDHDVFGDGSVRILRAPGHTPGHQVLMLQLAKAGTLILSGDLYHTRDNFRHGRIPAINTSRAETLASFARIGKLIEKHKARLVIQHAPEDFAALPEFPAYLD